MFLIVEHNMATSSHRKPARSTIFCMQLKKKLHN